MSHRVLRPHQLLLVLCVVLLPSLARRDAEARLEPAEWRQVQENHTKLFAKRGQCDDKAENLAQLLADGDKRAWKLIIGGLVKEAEFWVEIHQEASEKQLQINEIQAKEMVKRTPAEQRSLGAFKEELAALEDAARDEREILDAFSEAIVVGPEALRTNLFNRAKGSPSWAVRAAAARVAAIHPGEKKSFGFLSKVLTGDKDARVRLSALESLGEAALQSSESDEPDGLEAVEGLILGRLADKDWGVKLLAVRIIKTREMKSAIPHLINALASAGPRLAEAIGEVLCDLTGENFDPYADVWAKWWKDHQADYESTERVRGGRSKRPPSGAHFYGLPVKSDRILFIIDTSSSMKEPTKNLNPAEKWKKPTGPVTPKDDAPPPPPPPEEILSGPKIKVAQHELKKAIQKLPPSAMFNIIEFNTAVSPWREKMQKADEKTKKEALTWVRALEPKGITYIDGALRRGFEMAGLGSFDKAYPEVNIDTIVLLSDGAPTDDDIKSVNLMEPEIILQHVREWNRHKRIVIHCIGVDMVETIVFLEKLAAENGGKYVDR